MDKEDKHESVPVLVKTSDIKGFGWGVRHIQSAGMFLTITVLFMSRSCIGVAILAMTDMKRDGPDVMYSVYPWDKKIQGFVLSSFFWGYVVMQVPGGFLTKRFGGKPVLMMSLLVNSLISALTPTLAKWGDWPVVIASRVVMGLTQAFLFPTCHALIGAWLPARERTTSTAFIYGGPKLGLILGLPVFGVLAETKYGWPLIFYCMALMKLIVAIFWWKFTSSSPREHSMISVEELEYIEDGLKVVDTKTRPIPWKGFVTCKALWALMIVHTGFNSISTFMIVEMPSYMEKGLGISLKNSAILSGVPYIGMWLTGIICSAISEKLINNGSLSKTTSRKINNSISFFSIGTGFIVLTIFGNKNTTLAVVTLIVTLSLEGFVTAGFMVNHLDMSPSLAGVLLSLTNGIANLASIATPIYTGYVLKNDATDVSRWNIVFWTMAGVCITTNTIYVIMGSCKRQPWDDPDYQHEGNDKEKTAREKMIESNAPTTLDNQPCSICNN